MFRRKTLAEKAQDRINKGLKPSPLSQKIVGKLSDNRINNMFLRATKKYNKEHEQKISV
ncbi:TPA: hypothetical protein KDZ67_004620 [Vibrio parahaemolyticus]|nr:hypothetical protein [Vibrio parahaemolyticus]